MNCVRLIAALGCVAGAAALAATPDSGRAHVPGATLTTVLPPAPDIKSVTVSAFDMDRAPVTNAMLRRR